jgi:tetratricopeptide (TPR) repeat protein/serine/threonine protein kinase
LEHGNPPAVTVDDSITERPGTVIGPYKLIEQIGEGGMGMVWMAQQTEPVKRLVAVKLIKAGMDSRQVIARFEAERQALALMDHANIARALDAGTTKGEPGGVSPGRPYFVMDLVKGVPITKYCDEHHLTPRQRLELFIPVCLAVQHAHQKGIIHRDLKPSNVLVALYDGKPVPKVIDFGVAKAAGQQLTDKTLVTGFGNIVGTLEYMSPEQAEINQLDIDTRSDIYSLGVLLYELLTGSPPFTRQELEKGGVLEMLRVIREQEPTRPSTKLSTADGLPILAANRGTESAKLMRLVRGELDWIVMKALEKDRSRRYETANGFAMDVQRYLADEPVLACPPSAGYRLKKFVRRNKGGLAVAALVLLFLVLLGSGIGWAVRDRSARQAKAAGQVESILTEVDRFESEQKWPEALAAALRAEVAVAGGEADAATAQRVRERVRDLVFIDRLEQIRMEKATWIEGGFDIAGANREYSRAFREYGVNVEELAVETSIDRLRTRPALAIALAAALVEWAYVRAVVSGKDAAGWERLMAVARGIDPEPLRDQLRSTWGQPFSSELQDKLRRLAQSIDIRAQHPATLASLARTLLQRLKHSDAALRLLRDAQYVYPGDFWLNFELGNALHARKDHEGAIRFFTAAVAIRPQAAAAHTNLGVALRNLKKLDEAVAAYRKAIEISPKHAIAHYNLGNALREQKKLPEAVDAYRKAVAIDPKLADAYHNLGSTLSEQRKLPEAVEAYRNAIGINPKHPYAYGALGDACRELKKLPEAVAAYQKAVEIDPKNAKAHIDLGGALLMQRRPNEAIDAFRKVIEIDPKSKLAAHAYFGIGKALEDQGKPHERIAYLEKAVELDPKHAVAHNTLAWVLTNGRDAKFRDPQRGLQVARKAVELAPQSATAWLVLGWAYYRAGQWKASIEALEKSCALENNPKGGGAFQWFFLAMAHWQLGEKDKAREWYDRATGTTDGKAPGNTDFLRFRAEAAALLGVEEKKDQESAKKPK